MAEKNTAAGSDNVAPTSAAISAALQSNLALQSELRSRIFDVRKLRSRNRHDAAAVISSLSLIWSSDSDTSIENAAVDKRSPIPFDVLARKLSSSNDDTQHTRNKNEHIECNSCIWKEEEVKQLQNSIDEARKETSNQTSDNEVILDQAASKCKIPSRSARDCKTALFTFADPAIVTSKFTKRESRFILDITSELDGKDIDWFEIAVQLNEKIYPSKQHRRTPWQCFKHYQSTLKKNAVPWTSDEDELFLKYLAAHGHGYILQGDGLARTNSNLFPYRNPNKLSIRTHTTLFNPNYAHDGWTKDEERKLALLMRAYSESEGTLPLKQAAQSAHFPSRAQTLVGFKWHRSVCPELQQMRGRDESRDGDAH